MVQAPLSPPAEPGEPPLSKPVPLDSLERTTAIHPVLSAVRVPGEPLPSYKYHPVTCLPIDIDEVRSQLEQLRREYDTPQSALKAQEQAARDAKEKIEALQKKRQEVQRAMDKKLKERDTELKVLSKYQEVKVSDIPN